MQPQKGAKSTKVSGAVRALILFSLLCLFVARFVKNFPDTLRDCNRNQVRSSYLCLRTKRYSIFRRVAACTYTVDSYISLRQPSVAPPDSLSDKITEYGRVKLNIISASLVSLLQKLVLAS